jgi:hypothetical protein
MSAQTYSGLGSRLAGRVDADALRLFVVGDLLAILAFVVAGELRHGIHPLVAPLAVADTALQFYVGWAVAAPLVGAYARSTLDSRRSMLVASLGAWLLAVVVAQALRATPWFRGDAAASFALVSVAVGGVLLLGWRVARTAIRGSSA